jgi:hypothetical protein
LLSLPAGTEMFHFPALPPPALCIQAGATAHDGRQVSPFGNPRITAWLPAPRGLSQAPASFIGSWCQGIHRVPLKTWHTHTLQTTVTANRRNRRCSRPLCSSQKTGGTRLRTARQGRTRDRPHPEDPETRPANRAERAPVSSGPNSVPTRPPANGETR